MLKLGVIIFVLRLAAAGPPVTRSRQEIQDYIDFLEESRKDDGLPLSERMQLNPKASVWENSGKFEGDIILDDWQVEVLVQQFASPHNRKAFIWPDTKWPDNTVVYELANGYFNDAQQKAIWEAMDFISYYTCLRFRVREPWDFNYVRITGDPGGCYADMGYWRYRGVHSLNLTPEEPGYGCFVPTVIVHEWLHIIGMFHMQSTYDRDEYVRVLWDNVHIGMEHNFDRYGTDLVSNLGVPYEYDSCMHYGPYGFNIGDQPTLEANRPITVEMGQQMYVTWNDWLRTRRHYNCPGAWSSTEEEASANKFELPTRTPNTEKTERKTKV